MQDGGLSSNWESSNSGNSGTEEDRGGAGSRNNRTRQEMRNPGQGQKAAESGTAEVGLWGRGNGAGGWSWRVYTGLVAGEERK